MNIVVCPLVSRDLPKAVRSVSSALNMMPTTTHHFSVVPIVNSKNQKFIDEFSMWCESANITFQITESHGTPSKGKNECLNFFRNSSFDGMCMLDGDDMCYPSASLQIERHLNHHPNTDVLIVKPSDQIVSHECGTHIKDNIYAVCWGTNDVQMNYKYGPAKHELFENRHAASNLGGHVFYSKKLVELVSYDEQQLLGEDLLMEFEMLKLHQEGKISFWLSFATDVQFLDRTNNENIQSQKNDSDGEYYFNRLTEKVKLFLNIERSSFNELPVEFPPLIMSYLSKIQWIKDFATSF